MAAACLKLTVNAFVALGVNRRHIFRPLPCRLVALAGIVGANLDAGRCDARLRFSDFHFRRLGIAELIDGMAESVPGGLLGFDQSEHGIRASMGQGCRDKGGDRRRKAGQEQGSA